MMAMRWFRLALGVEVWVVAMMVGLP